MSESRRPSDERDILNLPKIHQPVVHERETIRSDGSSGALEAVGRQQEGLDGKKYIGSVAVHFYEVQKLFDKEHVFLFQSTDITQIPEPVMVVALPELGRVLMQRYGHKPPAKTTDKYVRESENKV